MCGVTQKKSSGIVVRSVSKLLGGIAISNPEVTRTEGWLSTNVGSMITDAVAVPVAIAAAAAIGAFFSFATLGLLDVLDGGDILMDNNPTVMGVGATGFALAQAGSDVKNVLNEADLDAPSIIACTSVIAFRAACAAKHHFVSQQTDRLLKQVVRLVKPPDADSYLHVLECLSTNKETKVLLLTPIVEFNILRNPSLLEMWWPSALQLELPVNITQDGSTITITRAREPLFPTVS